MNQLDDTEPTAKAEPNRPLVLVVDDDEENRDALREILDEAGFATVGARHGLEALTMLATLKEMPTFILLDMTMPVMDGWEFCENRGKSQILREIPVIAISAADLTESERPAGIDAFLPKPIDIDKFAGLVIRTTGRRSRDARHIRFVH